PPRTRGPASRPDRATAPDRPAPPERTRATSPQNRGGARDSVVPPPVPTAPAALPGRTAHRHGPPLPLRREPRRRRLHRRDRGPDPARPRRRRFLHRAPGPAEAPAAGVQQPPRTALPGVRRPRSAAGYPGRAARRAGG